jgi:hypothetical protein
MIVGRDGESGRDDEQIWQHAMDSSDRGWR